MVKLDFKPEVEIWPFCTCAMHPAVIIGTVRLLWTWLWGTYHVLQNACLVSFYFYYCMTGCSCHTNTAFVAKDRWTSPFLTTPFYVCNFLYVIHDVRNFNEHINGIDIRVDNVRPDENWVTTEAHSVQFSEVELSWVGRSEQGFTRSRVAVNVSLSVFTLW